MKFFLILAIKIAAVAIQSFIAAFGLSFSIYDFLEKIKASHEKQKRGAIKWLICSILFTLSMYAYAVSLFLFR